MRVWELPINRFEVPDVEAACQRFEELGVQFVKKPNDGRMKGLAFIKVRKRISALLSLSQVQKLFMQI